MTGSIKTKCKGCGIELWFTWGDGGPKKFLDKMDNVRYCDECRERMLFMGLEDSSETGPQTECERYEA